MPRTNSAVARPNSMGRAGALLLLLPALALTLSALACGEDTFDLQWTSTIDTVTIYSLARPELTRVSAFNFNERTTVRIEAAGASRAWDVALDTRGGQLVVIPPGTLGVDSRARIVALPGQTFTAVQMAPSDTLLYSAASPLPASRSTTYVVKTDLRSSPFGVTCQYYAKFQPIELDAAAGSMKFIYDVSPACNDRRLVPPDSLK